MRPDRRKCSLYFPDEILRQLQAEAVRLDRSMSWLVQYAWKHGGFEAVSALPSIEEVT